ncbi:MAG: 3'-5' exonuclease domain-containing protein 2 [Paludibacteraceae bacterium]|nr:3'-5' exonuclease domain-containing protein 2 [Paludibacteraceae bacterium]
MNYQAKITKEEIESLPVLSYPGRQVTVVETTVAMEEAYRVLVQSPLIGFDTETKPSFVKGVTNKVALVQLSTADHCYLIRVHKLGFPKALVALLSDARLLKVGLSLRDDFRAMSRRMQFQPAGFVDLQNEVGKVGIEDLSLQKIYAIMFGKKISKSQRLTNWEASSLTEPQQFYAAIDAWACMDIWQQLKRDLCLTNQ